MFLKQGIDFVLSLIVLLRFLFRRHQNNRTRNSVSLSAHPHSGRSVFAFAACGGDTSRQQHHRLAPSHRAASSVAPSQPGCIIGQALSQSGSDFISVTFVGTAWSSSGIKSLPGALLFAAWWGIYKGTTCQQYGKSYCHFLWRKHGHHHWHQRNRRTGCC